jgi:large subunit ribosomal protein L4
MKADIYNQKGTKAGAIDLPAEIFGLPWNANLVHDTVVAMQGNARTPVAHSKGRGDVSGGGIKPWRQKGTGRARHGSNRSPIWIGGGVTFGPTNERNYDRKINKKAKTKTLFTILSQSLRDGNVLFLDTLTLPEAKTRAAQEVLTKISGIDGFAGVLTKKRNSAVIALPTLSDEVARGFQNFSNLNVIETRNLNPVLLMKYKHLILVDPQATIEFLESKTGARATKDKKKTAAAAK